MFVDTSGWLCALDDRDHRHREARLLFEAARTRRTHNFVLAELVPLSGKRGFSRKRTLQFIDEVLDDPTIKMTRAANRLLQSRSDKEWSLCDAVSFVLMERAGEREALTTDHHFEQAGFIRLLES
jgi:uncharacterized protein